jgi:uncharacterized protein
MTFSDPPPTAAWKHGDAQVGFEVVFFHPNGDGLRIEGATSAVEEGEPWAVDYVIELDGQWVTQRAVVRGRSRSGERELTLEADGAGGWTANGDPVPAVEGCLDVDLESSSMTNAFPVHRLGLEVGAEAEAPATYVRALDLRVERLEQRYTRKPDEGKHQRFHYVSVADGFEAELVYDEAGLVLDYPGIAVRAL